MDQEGRESRDTIRQEIENRAKTLLENGVHPFEVQKRRAEAGKELARTLPDTEKYQQAASLAAQYIQKETA